MGFLTRLRSFFGGNDERDASGAPPDTSFVYVKIPESLGPIDRDIRPALKVLVDDQPWVRVERFDQEEYCDQGLRRRGGGPISVPWSTVRRVALGYEIPDSLAIADWDFWAFQTDDPLVTYWVDVDVGSPFWLEVTRRFNVGKVPPMAEWADRDFNIRAFVVWPLSDFGEPMYVTVKRKWWSWSGRLAYTKTFSSNGGG